MVTKRKYWGFGEIDLLLLICEGDKKALAELLNARRFFTHYERNGLLLPELLELLRREHVRIGGSREADMAYDRTIDKFTRLPEWSSPRKVDCRRYYQAVVDKVDSIARIKPVDRNKCAKDLLNRFVYRHFQLSIKECKRNMNFTRYSWKVGESQMPVFMPRSIVGKERAKWLTDKIPDDVKKSGDRNAVQAIIDDHFGNMETSLEVAAKKVFWETDFRDDLDDLITSDGLAQAVACEKSDRLDEQRPSIRKLGEEKVKKLVLTVFRQLDEDAYDEATIASQFEISSSTFSRFAGSRWKRNRGGGIPDLWRNLAGVLANNKNFLEACKLAHVWEEVRSVVKNK